MTEFMNIAIPSKPLKVSETATRGTYEIAGLYPGYGHTLGNALRRILLSSIPGAAITEVRVKGASHEFSTIEGIKEDVLTMVLHIKKIRVAVNTSEFPQKITLKKKGKGVVTAADFECPAQVVISNKDQVICEITDAKGEVEIEATIEKGFGFRSREDAVQKAGVGVIVLDAIFSPVIRSSYEVEDMRVGNRTDFNKLKISIETDGTVTPSFALETSIRTMLVQFEAMLGFKAEDDMKDDEEMHKEAKAKKIDEIGLSSAVLNALEKAEVKTVAGLIKKGHDGVRDINGIGDKAFNEIVEKLAHYGIVLKK